MVFGNQKVIGQRFQCSGEKKEGVFVLCLFLCEWGFVYAYRDGERNEVLNVGRIDFGF